MMIEEAVGEEDEIFTVGAIRHAQLICVIINMLRGSKEAVARVEDYLPQTVVQKIFPASTPMERRQAQIEKARSLAAKCEAAQKRR
jgi:hypothetical protein